MSVNLLEKVQQQMGFPPLQKIDPNTQGGNANSYTFEQAAVPAVLTALYKYVQSDTGAEEVLRGSESTNWVGKIFHGNHSSALEKIQTFSKGNIAGAANQLNTIANVAISIMKENVGDNATIKEVKNFFLNQRTTILPYLVPELHLGELLHDDTVDDNTNKMEGPISSLMNSIGSAFSNPVVNEDANK